MAYAIRPVVTGNNPAVLIQDPITPRAVDQFDAAAHLGVVSPKTLENWRGLGIGPRYAKLGGRVAYRIADLDAWLEEQVVA